MNDKSIESSQERVGMWSDLCVNERGFGNVHQAGTSSSGLWSVWHIRNKLETEELVESSHQRLLCLLWFLWHFSTEVSNRNVAQISIGDNSEIIDWEPEPVDPEKGECWSSSKYLWPSQTRILNWHCIISNYLYRRSLILCVGFWRLVDMWFSPFLSDNMNIPWRCDDTDHFPRHVGGHFLKIIIFCFSF